MREVFKNIPAPKPTTPDFKPQPEHLKAFREPNGIDVRVTIAQLREIHGFLVG